MVILKIYLNDNFPSEKLEEIIPEIQEIKGVEKVVERSEDMSAVFGFDVLGLALEIATLSIELILMIRKYFKNKKLDATMEFKCNGKELTIKGKMTVAQIKELYEINCG